MTIKDDLPQNLKNHLDSKISELKESLEKANLTLPQNYYEAGSELIKVILFSEFATSSFIRNPLLLIDLIESGDLEKSYNDEEYKLKIDSAMQNLINTIKKEQSECDDNKNNSTSESGSIIKSDNIKIDEIMLKELLINIREREMIRIAWQDINEKVSLEQTLKDLSLLAEASVDKAITFIYDELCFTYGTPLDKNNNIQKLIVLGMGKLGAGELNFSSDIDLIFAYPEDTPFEGIDKQGRAKFNTTGEFFTTMCKKFLQVFDPSTISQNIGTSTLFRVDTRLRPFGANGPIAMSFYSMEEYYQTQGRDWERYALIKARPIAGGIESGYTLLKILNPFIYRRYFDYGSFDSLREMKKRIALQVKDKRFKNNIKLGAGGIREIEFFGQVFQLIRGGVEPEFQERKILKIIDLLIVRNCIEEQAGKELNSAYYFLRKVEHRLQEYNDRQTHDLPEKDDDKLRLALSMGFNNTNDFYDMLNQHLLKVHSHFKHLFESDADISQNQDDKAKHYDNSEDLKYIWQNINDPQFNSTGYKVSGFEDSTRFSNILRHLAEHPNTKKLTAIGRKRLDRLMPLLIHKIGHRECRNNNNDLKNIDNSINYENENIDQAKHASKSEELLISYNLESETLLQRLIDLIITIERRTCYLSLLIEKPQALDNLVNLAEKSPWIISFLSLHPALLDELLAPLTLYSPPDRHDMEKDIKRRMAHIPSEDFEFQLEELSIFKQVMMLRVAAADLSGNYPLMKVSDRLTEAAETVMNKVIEISWHHTVIKYGMPSGISDISESDVSPSFLSNSCDSSFSTSSFDNNKFSESDKEKEDNIPPYLKSDPSALSLRSSSPLFTSYSVSSCSQFYSPGFAAVAYGKLGGIELGYKSDLDMVFIYSGEDGYTKGGARSIENIRFYTFLGQRIISALTLHTQAGKLYEADMRLRPSGQSGMIVSHIDAFHDYIKNEAWTWEHQAIIRARPIAGDIMLQKQFNSIREQILCIKREPDILKKEVGEMRERMRKEHLKCEPDMFDLKQSRGGIIDIEFLVQYLVLQYASEHIALTKWTDNVRLLETLASENILTSKESLVLKQGYLKLRQMVHHLNLQEKEKIIPIEEFKNDADEIVSIFEKFLLIRN